MNEQQRDAIQAAAFRSLISHLQQRTDAQNIDIMNLAGFCRNCLSKWVKAASDEKIANLTYDNALEMVYGMPYGQWKAQHQTKASQTQIDTFGQTKHLHAKISGHQ